MKLKKALVSLLLLFSLSGCTKSLNASRIGAISVHSTIDYHSADYVGDFKVVKYNAFEKSLYFVYEYKGETYERVVYNCSITIYYKDK